MHSAPKMEAHSGTKMEAQRCSFCKILSKVKIIQIWAPQKEGMVGPKVEDLICLFNTLLIPYLLIGYILIVPNMSSENSIHGSEDFILHQVFRV